MVPTYYARKGKGASLVEKISQVDIPAIMTNYIAMDAIKKMVMNSEKTCLVGPVLIPEIDILRYNEEVGYYNLRYDAELIKECMQNFIDGGLTGESNIQHNDNYKIEGDYSDNWIITESTHYKAKALGFSNLPLGTWMTAFFPKDKSVLTDELLSNIKGFSIEGWFYEEKLINNENMVSKVLKLLKEALAIKEKKVVKVLHQILTTSEGVIISIDDVTQICNYLIEDGLIGELVPDGFYFLDNGATLEVASGIGTITMQDDLEVAEVLQTALDQIKESKSKLKNALLEIEALKKTSQKLVIALTTKEKEEVPDEIKLTQVQINNKFKHL